MAKVNLKREEPNNGALLSNEFAAGVIRGIKEFKVGKLLWEPTPKLGIGVIRDIKEFKVGKLLWEPTPKLGIGVIRGIKEFKAGKGKTYDNKEEFLNSLRDL